MRGSLNVLLVVAVLALLGTACTRKDVVTLRVDGAIGSPLRVCVIGRVTGLSGVEGSLRDGDTVEVQVRDSVVRLEGELLGLLFPGGDTDGEQARLVDVDLSQCERLAYFGCRGGMMREIDLSHNPNLEYLALERMALGSLSLRANVALIDLRLRHCELSAIDLSANANLKYLLLDGNHLTTLDLSGNPLLELLNCAGSSLRELHVGSLSQLKWLWCNQNDLSVLDLSGNPLLELVDCSRNRIRTLDFGGSPNAIEVSVHTNIMGLEGMGALVRSLPQYAGEAGLFIPLYADGVGDMNELNDDLRRMLGERGWRVATPGEETSVDSLLSR